MTSLETVIIVYQSTTNSLIALDNVHIQIAKNGFTNVRLQLSLIYYILGDCSCYLSERQILETINHKPVIKYDLDGELLM